MEWIDCWIVCCPFTQRLRWLRVIGYVFLAHQTQTINLIPSLIHLFNKRQDNSIYSLKKRESIKEEEK